MNTNTNIKEIAKKTILQEAKALEKIAHLVDDDYANSVNIILQAKGRVIVTGIGKSAIIAQKIVATFNSTGTPSVFMHAADAIHGDLGIIQKGDVIICLSKSGNTPEIKTLIPLLKQTRNQLIAITSNRKSFLAESADFILDAFVEKEACPNNLAPTTSTTAQLAIGDALAVCLLNLRNFNSSDFAQYHPGGALGKKLYMRVSDIIAKNKKPEVHPETPVKQVIVEISEKMLGVTAVIENQKIIGVITDGDIRRMLNAYDQISSLKARDIMSLHPKTIEADALASDAVDLMETHRITQLLVIKDGIYQGVVHLHNLIQEGII